MKHQLFKHSETRLLLNQRDISIFPFFDKTNEVNNLRKSVNTQQIYK
jgi:hypothetical protein